MKLNSSMKLRKLGNRYFIVDNKQRVVNFNDIYELNESAAYLWKKVGDGDFTEETLKQFLLEKYEVNEEKAANDVKFLIGKWQEWGMISETIDV
jgi:hypothetical protein